MSWLTRLVERSGPSTRAVLGRPEPVALDPDDPERPADDVPPEPDLASDLAPAARPEGVAPSAPEGEDRSAPRPLGPPVEDLGSPPAAEQVRAHREPSALRADRTPDVGPTIHSRTDEAGRTIDLPLREVPPPAVSSRAPASEPPAGVLEPRPPPREEVPLEPRPAPTPAVRPPSIVPSAPAPVPPREQLSPVVAWPEPPARPAPSALSIGRLVIEVLPSPAPAAPPAPAPVRPRPAAPARRPRGSFHRFGVGNL